MRNIYHPSSQLTEMDIVVARNDLRGAKWLVMDVGFSNMRKSLILQRMINHVAVHQPIDRIVAFADDYMRVTLADW